MNMFRRDKLKEFFSGGKRPNQQQFEALINSTVNILDDGYSKDKKDGLKITPTGDDNILMSFCAKSQDAPSWIFTIKEDEDLYIETKKQGEYLLHKGEEIPHPSLFLNARKTVITGDVEVQGVKKGISLDSEKFQPVADGNWHNITEDLYGMYAMEITAYITGAKSTGEYALMIAWTTHCFGSKKIRTLGSYYGFFGHKIKLRWKKNK